jgi:hypothetical protein
MGHAIFHHPSHPDWRPRPRPSLTGQRDYAAQKHPGGIKSVCDKVGGKLSQDTQGFGCGTDCHGQPGTDCTLYCKINQKCAAQTMGGRRATNFENALKTPERHTR